MIELPDTRLLVAEILGALKDVAQLDEFERRRRGNWTDAICGALEQRLSARIPDIECTFGSQARGERREWLFDFIACACETSGKIDNPGERYLSQAFVVGEIGFQGDPGHDLEKLFIVDSLVCFFVFPDWLPIESPPDSNLDFFTGLAERRIHHVAARGATPPPVFVISRYSSPEREFQSKVVGLPN